MLETPILLALTGGSLIGIAASLLLIYLNKVAGISGIASGILPPWNHETTWRLYFLAGLVFSAVLYRWTIGEFSIQIETPTPLMIIAGLLVGYGSRLGGGCTSGHGICGLSRLSLRSLVATLVFMTTAALSVFILKHLI